MNQRKRKAFSDRRSIRQSELGRLMEDEVEAILLRAKDEGLLSVVTHHPLGTPRIDFTVEKVVSGEAISRSFGMTTSVRIWNERRNGEVPQFCFPVGVKPETVVRRVLELFE